MKLSDIFSPLVETEIADGLDDARDRKRRSRHHNRTTPQPTPKPNPESEEEKAQKAFKDAGEHLKRKGLL
jgi:hypothetical protein